jgi:hypothetical protein
MYPPNDIAAVEAACDGDGPPLHVVEEQRDAAENRRRENPRDEDAAVAAREIQPELGCAAMAGAGLKLLEEALLDD